MVLHELPAGYEKIREVDLKNNKKDFWIVNGLGIFFLLAIAVPGLILLPARPVELTQALWQLAAFLLCSAAYLVLHEAVHGIVMKICGAGKLSFGMTSVYAYAGSNDYFGPAEYRVVALAPLAVFTVVFVLLTVFVSAEWKWVFCILEAINVSGAAGDVYVFFLSFGWKKTALVQDTGVAMQVFDKNE